MGRRKKRAPGADVAPVKTESHTRSTKLLLSTLTSLEAAMRSANELPPAHSLDFACTTYPKIKKMAHANSCQILSALHSVGSRYDITFGATDVGSDNTDSDVIATAYEEIYEQVGQVSEEILERFNAELDAARGIKNAAVPFSGGIEPGFKIQGAIELKQRKGGIGWVEMEKPQLKFPDYPIDNSDTPFVPPYGETVNGAGNVASYLQDLYKANSNAGAVWMAGGKHPYEKEIKAASEEMGSKSFDEKNTMLFKELNSTPCIFVDTEDVLFEMAEQLNKAVEIAVDIENHSMRSFQGFTCLIQFSTRRADFVVDALALRGNIHRALAPLFSDESTVKVMHGAEKDVEWLERDFGIYVVNLFDTGQAARELNFPSCSLSHLLAKFCSISSPNKKKFQLADWRKRPLPKAMYDYARSDTHYLLYAYDRLRAELGKKDQLASVWTKSAKVALRRHTKARYNEMMPRRLAAKHGLGFDRHQMRLFEELYRWRDRKAREEDESLHYVAPLNSLLAIVRARDDCKTIEGLLEKGFPSANAIPPLIWANVKELVTLITHVLDSHLIDDKEEQTASMGNRGEAEQEVAINSSDQPCGPTGTRLECDATQEDCKKPIADAELETCGVLSVAKEGKRVSPVRSTLEEKSSAVQSDSTQYGGQNDVRTEEKPHREVRQKLQRNEDGQKTTEERLDLKHRQGTGEGEGGMNDRVVTVKLASRSVFDFSSDEEESPDEKTKMAVGKAGQCKSRESCGAGGLVGVKNDGRLSAKGTGIEGGAAKRSKFDLSSDEEEGEAKKTREIIAQVHAGMTRLGPSVPSEFRVEGDEVEDKTRRDERVPVEKKRDREEEDENVGQEKTVQSLSEMYGVRAKRRKKKKAGKNKVNDGGALVQSKKEQPERSENAALFDYGKMKDISANKVEDVPFDPLEKLRNDWKGKKSKARRVRKPNKRPGSGARSMSFKSG
eukprot:GFKZ01000415.1.p1 GENE.GFKZ01000415.1~~GFKZ01000415.1.p1  ORF type:complete len:952 (-),score=188.85 GFKZ01000415.1:68-2923(-)